MIYEIAGARSVGPYFGTSVLIWTSLIGIVMGSLSLGYWFGGWISTKKADIILLGWIVLLAAFFVFLTAIADKYILDRVIKYIPGIRLQTVISVMVLFSPASIFFGMVLPVSVKLKIGNLATSGSMVGNLYALSSIGSITGTFLAGFLLLPQLGFKNVIFLVSLLLAVLASIGFISEKKYLFAGVPAALIVITLFAWTGISNKELNYIDTDTKYSRVIIYNTTDQNSGRPVKILKVNDEKSSAMFTDRDDDPVFKVLRYYKLIEYFVPDFKKTLMIGGSGYAFPKFYLKKYPDAQIDVVEIDPGLTEIAKEHFNLIPDPDLNIIHEDGRTYLNRTKQNYDAILVDAYKSMITIPFQLTTSEAIQKTYDALSNDGVVMANIISSFNPNENKFLRSEVATYKSIFPQVYLIPVQYPEPEGEEVNYFQNFMLIGLKSNKPFRLESSDPELNEYLQHAFIPDFEGGIILTDEYAPVEFFAVKALH
jgi:predicted membrane-bound spermidine synthase